MIFRKTPLMCSRAMYLPTPRPTGHMPSSNERDDQPRDRTSSPLIHAYRHAHIPCVRRTRGADARVLLSYTHTGTPTAHACGGPEGLMHGWPSELCGKRQDVMMWERNRVSCSALMASDETKEQSDTTVCRIVSPDNCTTIRGACAHTHTHMHRKVSKGSRAKGKIQRKGRSKEPQTVLARTTDRSAARPQRQKAAACLGASASGPSGSTKGRPRTNGSCRSAGRKGT